MKVLIIKLGSKGDVLRTTSLLRGIKQKYKGDIYWLTKLNSYDLLENNEYIKNVFVLDPGIEQKLERENFDLVINLDEDYAACKIATSLSKNLIGFYLKDKKITPTETAVEWFNMGALGDKPRNDLLKKRNKKTYQQIMKEIIGLDRGNLSLILNLTEKEKAFARRFAKLYGIRKGDLVIGLNTGAGGRWALKKLSINKTARLAERLYNELNAKIILLGGPEEKERNKKIFGLVQAPIIDGGCDTSLMQFASLIDLCSIVVSSDSLAMHIAIALHRKVVVFFGPTSSAEIELYGYGKKVIPDIECLCCYKNKCDKKPNCIDKISVDILFNSVKSLIELDNSKIRVSMIGTLPPIKGNAYYCESLSKELSKYIDIDFIAFKKLYPDFLYPGATIDKVSSFDISENKNLSVKRMITYYNPFSWISAGFSVKHGIVHSQWWSMPTFPIFFVIYSILKMRGKKIILTVHNVVPHEQTFLDKMLTKIILSFADKLIVHSECNVKDLMTAFKIPKKKIELVPMGVHDTYVEETISKEEARKKLNIPLDANVLLTFGNIRRYKGVDDLIRAFSKVCNEIRDSYMMIVGQLWINWDSYKRMINDLGLRKKVITKLSYVSKSDVKIYFSAADVITLPYKSFNAQSGVGNIALAFGKPLVVTRVGGLPDLVKDEQCIVPANEPDKLAKAIIRILRNKKIQKRLGKDSFKLAKIYSWTVITKKTLALYRKLLKESLR